MDNLFKQKLQKTLIKKEIQHIDSSMFVYVGPANSDFLHSIRSSVPGNSPILYVYSGKPDQVFLTTAGKTPLVIPVEYSKTTMDNCALAINCLKSERIMFSCDASVKLDNPTFPEKLDHFLKNTLSGLYQEKIGRLTCIRCAIKNLPVIQKNYQVSVKTSGGTAVICGSGPSLQSQLKYLKSVTHKIYLIAIGKTAERLFRKGIYPDAVVFVDNTGHNLPWEDFFNKADPLLISLATVAPEVAGYAPKVYFGKGPGIFFNRAMTEWKHKLPDLVYSGTGTVTGLDFAIKSGFENICLIGNDLCLGEGGVSHISGYDREEKFQHKKVAAEGIDGSPVVTSIEFDNLRNKIEEYLKHSPKVIYNCTEYGAKIAGSTHMNFRQFIEQFALQKPDVDISIKKTDFKYSWSHYFEDAATEHATQLFESAVLPSSIDNYAVYRTKWIKHLSSLFIEDMKNDFERVNENENLNSENMVFPSFRKFAIDFIGQSNPEFAEYLKNLPEPSDKFEFCCNLTQYAYISMNLEDKTIPFTGSYLNMLSSSRAELKTFLDKNSYSPATHGIVFIEPGSWTHVTALGEIHPEAEVICLSLWPEVLSRLINYCMFFHTIPPRTVVIGADDKVKNWRRIFHKTVRNWKRSGKTPLFFENPYAKILPEFKQIYERLP